MLVITRQRGESIVIGSDITLTVMEIRGDKVRLGIAAPMQTPIHREEVWVPLPGQGNNLASLAWTQSQDPQRMLTLLKGRVSDRKLRLFAVALMHRLWQAVDERAHTVIAANCVQGLGVLADHADGRVGEEELAAARGQVQRAAADAAFMADMGEGGGYGADALWSVAATTASVMAESPWSGAHTALGAAAFARYWPEWSHPQVVTAARQAEAVQCRFLRELFGDSFQIVELDAAWLRWGEGTVVRLAQAAYHEQLPGCHLDASRIAVLADALEEAGCADADILRHLRDPGPHVRGCWVLDLLLSKDR